MPRTNWFQRNWRWAVPVGCLGYAILMTVAGAGMAWLIFGMIRRSEIYQRAMERARDDPRVRRALGEPIEPGWWVVGNIEVSGSSGSADLMIPISGPYNSGRIFAIAEKRSGAWSFESLEVEIRGGDERIDLLVPPDILEVEDFDAPSSGFLLSLAPARDGPGRN